MELILGNHLKTEQTQKLVLNTEIIQSLNLLQFTSNELADYIAEEMTDNPLLDFGEEESSVYHMVDADRIMNPDEEPHIDEYNGYGRESDTGVLYADPQEWQRYSEFNGDGWAEEGGFSPYHGYGDFDDSPYDLSVSDEFTLEESLLNQVDLSEEPYLVRATAAYIVQTLDDNGYMTFSVPEIAQQLNISEELAEEARRLLWTFDPPGVGAVDLQECMKIQLRAIGRLNDKLSLIIDEHLPSLARGRYSAVARAVGMTPKDVGEAAELIRSLEPKPGRGYASSEATRYIVPDIVLEKVNGRYAVTVNGHTAPRLILRNDYRAMLRDSEKNSGVASFLSDRLNSAAWLIRSIEQRRDTLYRIASEVADFQREFFEKGRSYLKPMTMKQMAERAGVHESTVSRAVNGKYIQCPQGVYELKYFFSGGSSFSSDSGEVDSATSEGLKSMIVQLVENEDSASPMSDRRIAEAILIKGIAVSRRTIAKYREELGIPSSSDRRREKVK